MIFFQCHFLYFGRHSNPTVIVSDEKSAIIYVIAFLCITWQFSLTAFQIFYLLFSVWQFSCRVMYLLPPSSPYFLSLSFLFFSLPSVFLPSFPLSLWGLQSFLRSISSFHYMWKPSGHYFINFVCPTLFLSFCSSNLHVLIICYCTTKSVHTLQLFIYFSSHLSSSSLTFSLALSSKLISLHNKYF